MGYTNQPAIFGRLKKSLSGENEALLPRLELSFNSVFMIKGAIKGFVV
jgi:hypothetical protein